MSEREPTLIERSLRGAYINVPPLAAGLCSICTAPTSGPDYSRCFLCDQHIAGGTPLATSVVSFAWAPMAATSGYSGQAYLDLRQYKEPGASGEHVARLLGLLLLTFANHSTCLLPAEPGMPYLLAHIPSTRGDRQGEHPIQSHFLSRFRPEIPRVVPEFVGTAGGNRNDRRRLNPDNWHIPLDQVGDAKRALIVEDTWVSGGHAQSVAAAFEQLGIRTRVLVLGRALDPSRKDHGGYLRAHPDPPPFDIRYCPVHRTVHPA